MKTHLERLFDPAVWLVGIGAVLLMSLAMADYFIHEARESDRIAEDRIRAEQRRERHRNEITKRRNEVVLAKREREHQAFCDETCRVAFMTPLMHEDVQRDSEVAPQVTWERVCRCLRTSPDGRFRRIERFERNYNPLIDRDER